MSILFGTKFKDEQLILSAEKALIEEPTINASSLTIVSEKGIVTIGGKLKTTIAKRHALEAVKRAFQHKKLKYDRILDEIEVG